MELTYQLVGWIGSIAYAICGAPQAYDSWKKGHSRGMTWGFFVLWSIGEVFTFLYIIPMHSAAMVTNYSVNLVFLCIIGWYKIYPRKNKLIKRQEKSANLRLVK